MAPLVSVMVSFNVYFVSFERLKDRVERGVGFCDEMLNRPDWLLMLVPAELTFFALSL